VHNTVEDWVLGNANKLYELFYSAERKSWYFVDDPLGSPCELKRGEFISCGGTFFKYLDTAAKCPNGAALPITPSLNLSLGTYSYNSTTMECYEIINPLHAVHSDGDAGYVYEPWALKCGASRIQQKNWLTAEA